NFGTWRDTEGRLIWGVNDFDEVARKPYAIDLVRLVTSAIFAKRENGLSIDDSAAATAVLQGYSESLASGGKPFVLEENHPDLRAMALGAKRSVRERDPYYLLKDGWVIRRLGPHCGRIDLAQFPKHRDEKAILKAMGQETANLHLATSDQSAKVLRDL